MTVASQERLADELCAAGHLPPAWAPVFRAVDRAGFLPERVWVEEEDNAGYQPLDRATDPRRWWRAAYSNRVVVTQFDDGDTVWPRVGRRPTCSASMPSAVLGMLDAVDIQPGHRVLQIGTGTGYTAALLAHLGNDQVSTIELDLALCELARTNLTAAGYRPSVACGDGAAGYPSSVPFDRVLATATVRLGALTPCRGGADHTRRADRGPDPDRDHLRAGGGLHRPTQRHRDRPYGAAVRGVHGAACPTQPPR